MLHEPATSLLQSLTQALPLTSLCGTSGPLHVPTEKAVRSEELNAVFIGYKVGAGLTWDIKGSKSSLEGPWRGTDNSGTRAPQKYTAGANLHAERQEPF